MRPPAISLGLVATLPGRAIEPHMAAADDHYNTRSHGRDTAAVGRGLVPPTSRRSTTQHDSGRLLLTLKREK